MVSTLLWACALVAATVGIHACGLTALLTTLQTWRTQPPRRLWPITRLLIFLAWCMILLHLMAISVWGAFYLWQGYLPNAEAAFYFSGVTYAGIGYGDVVLAEPWRMLAPVEGLTGVLMCGLSTGVFFAVVNAIYQARQSKS